MKGDIRDIELRLVIRTDMDGSQLDRLLDELELEAHLMDGEKVLASHHTSKISYESVQLMKELGVK